MIATGVAPQHSQNNRNIDRGGREDTGSSPAAVADQRHQRDQHTADDNAIDRWHMVKLVQYK